MNYFTNYFIYDDTDMISYTILIYIVSCVLYDSENFKDISEKYSIASIKFHSDLLLILIVYQFITIIFIFFINDQIIMRVDDI